jgi:hypothetical protein
MSGYVDLFRRGIKNPHGAVGWLQYQIFKMEPLRFNKWAYRRANNTPFNDDGIDVLAADWDNLIVLDACRWDMFREESELRGSTERVESRASCTRGWLQANFTDANLHDTVYVTANPMFERIKDEVRCKFHDVINVWEADGWDKELHTVRPVTTTAYAEEAAAEYPNKRLLVHYMQPHFPFLEAPFEEDKLRPDIDADNSGFWLKLNEGSANLTATQVWNAYTENLTVTLPYVESLLTSLQGLSVVTSDHGNLLGERLWPIPMRFWGHPAGIYSDELVEVPWHSYTNGDRKSVESESPVAIAEESDEEKIDERLRTLGYKT